jgi:hypothetical protein
MPKKHCDIALEKSIICINPICGLSSVFEAPDSANDRSSFSHVIGACDPYWQEISSEARIGELLVYIWHAVVFLGVSPRVIHETLLVIPEYRDIMLV